MIIFNDSISKFNQCSIQNLLQAVVKTLTRHICLFQYLPQKKNAKAIKFLGIFNKLPPKNKVYFCLKKKNKVSLNRKVIFLILNNFQTCFHNADHILYYPQMSVFFFHTFLFYIILVSKKWNIETILTLPYSYNWQKFNNKMNEKRSQKYQSMGPEYVTGQINSHILELLSRQFCLIFALS